LSLSEVEVMMALVYGGLSQFVAVQSWPETLTPSSIATLALLTLTVNIRFSLMSATLRPWFGTLPPWQAYPSMLLITDGGWLAAIAIAATAPTPGSISMAVAVLARRLGLRGHMIRQLIRQ
jgi:predicted branched-subunit amino acid permease